MIIEGCYIPYDWRKHFSLDYLSEIKYICLVMSENYIKKHFQNIKKFANVIEARLDDLYCTIESTLAENAKVLRMCQVHQINYLLIDDEYNVDAQLKSVLER